MQLRVRDGAFSCCLPWLPLTFGNLLGPMVIYIDRGEKGNGFSLSREGSTAGKGVCDMVICEDVVGGDARP